MGGSRRFSKAAIAAALLFALGAARMFSLAAHSPMFGYANNYDFIGLSSVTGLYLDEPGVDRFAGHYRAPFSHYLSTRERRTGSYNTTDAVFVRIAIWLSNRARSLTHVQHRPFDLRALGLVKAAFSTLAGGWLIWLFYRRAPWQGVAMAAVFGLLIADPLNTLFFNTLYRESGAVVFAMLSIGFAVLICGSDRPRLWQLAIFSAVLIPLGVSKLQHIFLPLMLVLAFALVIVRKLRRRTAWLYVLPPLACALFALSFGLDLKQQDNPAPISRFAATDTWLGMVLPAIDDPLPTMKALGVPEGCRAWFGRSWLAPGMQPGPCPEIFALTRLQLIETLLKNPKAIGPILRFTFRHSRPFTIIDYGQVEGEDLGQLATHGPAFFSIDSWTSALPAPLYLTLIILMLAGGALAFVFILRGQPPPGATLTFFLCVVMLTTLGISLLGDGYTDICRHLHLADNSLLVALVPSVWMFVHLSRSARGQRAVARSSVPSKSTVPELGSPLR